jgi:hypothetical protein
MTVHAGRERLTVASWKSYPSRGFKSSFAFWVLAALLRRAVSSCAGERRGYSYFKPFLRDYSGALRQRYGELARRHEAGNPSAHRLLHIVVSKHAMARDTVHDLAVSSAPTQHRGQR